jgi:hypothetical protein
VDGEKVDLIYRDLAHAAISDADLGTAIERISHLLAVDWV